mmetsp:Transcript_84076/g.214028  ORF Transcript_84076/g.214028 Transcript_84076/m.214028 type:complete len:217 (-) Transcript_84076:82-732(-)|eukprot:CAMPEP_0183416286 /NCGR_PEP_ID=MMETSP0370-20130417/23664_1 /TAXON_ID=268820 /ORGANISM="Peridinium aciculiferum, Strain PAER-2" /LENGTH=216 /DNA_ID=CAMNT_0025599791 /DNA_START=54 /DNA_END=704 /DNA_ORIENTATION=-
MWVVQRLSALLRLLFALRRWRRGKFHGIRRSGTQEQQEGHNFPTEPSLLLILGGNLDRELASAAALRGDAREYSSVTHCLLSSGAASEAAVATACGLPLDRVAHDREAVDTLSNFTRTVRWLAMQEKPEEHKCVVVASSHAHLCRAWPVAVLVLGSHGIAVRTSCCVGDFEGDASESTWRLVRDVARALIYILTSWEGSEIAEWVHPSRQRRRKDD